MKMCHTEAMKELRNLESQKNRLMSNEDYNCIVSYTEGEEKVKQGYSYLETRAEIDKIDARVRKIRAALALANCTVKLDGFDITIGEGLVLMSQLNNKLSHLSSLARRTQLSRRITSNGVLEYTECLYNVAEVTAQCEEIEKQLSGLQIAIDRANLLNQIDI